MARLAKKQDKNWDPFAELRELTERINRAFGSDLSFARPGEGQTLANIDWQPSVNVSETDKAYMIRADLPDVKKEDIKVSCEKGMLTIEGERKHQKTEDNERFHRVESSYGRFMRRFSLPDDADESAIEAAHGDGGLSLRIPKAKNKAPAARQVKIS
jgi:HSP20 family protein